MQGPWRTLITRPGKCAKRGTCPPTCESLFQRHHDNSTMLLGLFDHVTNHQTIKSDALYRTYCDRWYRAVALATRKVSHLWSVRSARFNNTSVSAEGFGLELHALYARHEYVSHMHRRRELRFADDSASLQCASVAFFITRGILLFSCSYMHTLHINSPLCRPLLS